MLISGLNGYICEDCAAQAYQIVQENVQAAPAANQPKQGKPQSFTSVPKPKEIKEYLDQYVIGQDEAKRFLSVAVYTTISVCSSPRIRTAWR